MRSTTQFYMPIGKNNTLHVRWHLFHEFLFAYLFFPDTDVIMTLLQYFVSCIPFNYEDKRLALHWTIHK